MGSVAQHMEVVEQNSFLSLFFLFADFFFLISFFAVGPPAGPSGRKAGRPAGPPAGARASCLPPFGPYGHLCVALRAAHPSFFLRKKYPLSALRAGKIAPMGLNRQFFHRKNTPYAAFLEKLITSEPQIRYKLSIYF